MLKTKFAIGCLVQWYEIEMVGEYIQSVNNALELVDNPQNITLDFVLVTNQQLEKINDDISMQEIQDKFMSLLPVVMKINYKITDELYTIADYRRDFNDKYCTEVDVLMWGETDSLIPRQTFQILDSLHQHNVANNVSKYLTFFGTCRMWDDSWKPVEHNLYTDKPNNQNKEWWGTQYVTSIDEMNKINDSVTDLDVRVVSPHKFNGCGLVISSEIVKAGVNIPKSVFFTHEDTSFMVMTNKILGNVTQFVIKNILLVHNRNHPKKRLYVKDEVGNSTSEKRDSNSWYKTASKYSESNVHNIFNPQYKSLTWEDVWQTIK
tara:strand:- start:938 stop:1897 length:960 start_codon:yes stop_codon:yes gene_type:complete